MHFLKYSASYYRRTHTESHEVLISLHEVPLKVKRAWEIKTGDAAM